MSITWNEVRIVRREPQPRQPTAGLVPGERATVQGDVNGSDEWGVRAT